MNRDIYEREQEWDRLDSLFDDWDERERIDEFSIFGGRAEPLPIEFWRLLSGFVYQAGFFIDYRHVPDDIRGIYRDMTDIVSNIADEVEKQMEIREKPVSIKPRIPDGNEDMYREIDQHVSGFAKALLIFATRNKAVKTFLKPMKNSMKTLMKLVDRQEKMVGRKLAGYGMMRDGSL